MRGLLQIVTPCHVTQCHAAQRHDQFHRQAKGDRMRLRQHGAAARQRGHRPVLQGTALEDQLAAGRRELTRQQLQQRGFAGTTGPEDGHALTRLQPQLEGAEALLAKQQRRIIHMQ